MYLRRRVSSAAFQFARHSHGLFHSTTDVASGYIQDHTGFRLRHMMVHQEELDQYISYQVDRLGVLDIVGLVNYYYSRRIPLSRFAILPEDPAARRRLRHSSERMGNRPGVLLDLSTVSDITDAVLSRRMMSDLNWCCRKRSLHFFIEHRQMRRGIIGQTTGLRLLPRTLVDARSFYVVSAAS